jgi:hypothetical protein
MSPSVIKLGVGDFLKQRSILKMRQFRQFASSPIDVNVNGFPRPTIEELWIRGSDFVS